MRRSFARLGHHVVSCDIRPSEDHAPPYHFITSPDQVSPIGYHHTGDIFEFLSHFAHGYFHLGIYHAPCTYILQNGVKWLYYGGIEVAGVNPERWALMEEGAHFFKQLHEHPAVQKCASENPKMCMYAQNILGFKWSQHFQPYWFGHREKKDIYLWLRELPLLDNPPELYVGPAPRQGEPGYSDWAIVHTRGQRKGIDRGLERSAFYPGVSDQMALQWAGDASTLSVS